MGSGAEGERQRDGAGADRTTEGRARLLALRRSPRQLERVGAFAEARLGEAHAAGVVKEDAVLLAGPDGVRLEQPRTPGLEEQPARPAAARDQGLIERRLARVQVIVCAERLQ